MYPNLDHYHNPRHPSTFVICELSLQPQLLQIHLSPADLSYCNSLYSGISQADLSKLQGIRNSLARVMTKHFKISTHQAEHSKNYTGFLSNKESITKSVFLHTKHLQINKLHIFTIVFHFRHILFLHDLLIHLFFPFHMSDHHLEKGLSLTSVHDPGIHSLLIPETRLLKNIPFQAQNPPLRNCFPSLCSFPYPWTVYLDFDSCYSHSMPYRMTPSVRHRAIEVHYYDFIISYSRDMTLTFS